MKKSILNLGKALNKNEQREVNGGLGSYNQCNNLDKHSCEMSPDCTWNSSYKLNEDSTSFIEVGSCSYNRNETIPHIEL